MAEDRRRLNRQDRALSILGGMCQLTRTEQVPVAKVRIPTFLIFCAMLAPVGAAVAQPADDFYRRKKIRILVGSEPGAGFSTYSQLLGAHFAKHVPGEPAVTVEHMSGAGGVNAINYLANAAPTDGTAFAVAMPNFFVTPWTEPRAVRFDPAKFNFIGRISEFGRVLAVWSTSGVRSLDDLRRKPITLGASAKVSTTAVQPLMMNEMLGTKLDIILGYTGTGPTVLAIERGELASTTIAWSTLQSLQKARLEDGTWRVIAGLDFMNVPLPGVPRVRDLITDERKRALWDFVALPSEFGTAYVTAPGVPADKLKILREAFDATMRDPEFIAEAQKRNLDLAPKPGEELDTFYRQFGSPTPEITKETARLMGLSQ